MENANEAYQDAFGVMNSIQEQVQRSNRSRSPIRTTAGVPLDSTACP